MSKSSPTFFKSQSGGVGEFLLTLGFVTAVIAAIAYWIKPWEWVFNSLDERDAKIANRLATNINSYYLQRGRFPWNDAAGNYIPAPDRKRPENAFTYLANSGNNTEWVENLAAVILLETEDKNILTDGERFTILKQVSSGSRIALCFLPRSAKYRQLAADLCLTDSTGRREAPYAVAGQDPCVSTDGSLVDYDGEKIPNLYCEVVE